MKLQYLLALVIITPFISFSQEEKGCGIRNNFIINYGETPEGHVNNLLYCSGSYTVYCSSMDSIFIELDLDVDVEMRWFFKDELAMGYPSIFDSPIEWYRNDSIIDPNEYEVYDDWTGGACGPQHLAGAVIRTQILGSYQLRKTNADANLPVIVLLEKAASIVEVEEILFKIYPNPSSDVLYIEHGEVNSTEVILQSIDGKTLHHPFLEISEGTTRIDTSHLPSGSYILTFSSDKHETVRKKIAII